jgi:hypothetical protein
MRILIEFKVINGHQIRLINNNVMIYKSDIDEILSKDIKTSKEYYNEIIKLYNERKKN